MTGLITLTGTQAAFAPADTAALKAAVGTCSDGYDFNSATGRFNIICTGGCLGETPDGSCPLFAASNDATGNPHGVIGEWDVSRVTDMSNMFASSAFNGDISEWNTGAVISMADMFKYSVFNGDISKWNTGAVISMDFMFVSAESFNSDLSEWNTGAVTNMELMFMHATVFNQDLSKWDTGKVTSMRQMFMHATVFNQDLSKWNTGVVSDMYSMFWNSGFKRTLCGGQWGLAFSSSSGTKGRYGCCPAGSYMSKPQLDPFTAGEACSQCPPGSFGSASSNDDTNPLCFTCEPGKYNNNYGATSCDTCASDSYSIGGASSCSYSATTCPAGTYASGTACQPCSAGMYNLNIGGKCAVCSAGKYSTTTGSTDCDICSAGKYSTAVRRTTDCDLCTAGTYISDTTTATEHDQQDDCKVCSADKYSADTGTTDCDGCPAGTYISDTTTATKHDQVSDCGLPCSFADEFVGCTDDEWQQIKVFYSESCPT